MRVDQQIGLWGVTVFFATTSAVANFSLQATYAQGVQNPSPIPEAETLTLLKQGKEQFRQRDYRNAITTFNQAILLAPDQAEPYFNRGLLRFQLEDETGALDDFDDAVLRNPRLAQAYLYRGSLLLSLGDQSRGLVDLQQAAQLFSEQNNQAGYQRAVSLIKHFNPQLEEVQ